MARKKKNEEVISPVLLQIEAALKAKIEAIQKIADPAEQLLQYKALKKSTDGTYDPSKVRASKETLIGNGIFTGFKAGLGSFWTGVGIGAVALFGFSSLIGAGIAVGAGALSFAPAAFLGIRFGKKKGLAKYNAYAPEVKHATQMADVANGIDRAIERLVNSYTNSDDRDASLKALEKSPAREQVLKEFPRITAAFNDYSARKAEAPAGRAAFKNQPAPPPAA